MKVGQVSGIVRTQFGLHLIKVTNRAEGKEEPASTVEKVARNALAAALINRITEMGMDSCPIVITK